MPSYASVAAQNAPPQDHWPQPDPALLNTGDDASKGGPDFKEDSRSRYEKGDAPAEGDGSGSGRPPHRRPRPKTGNQPATVWDRTTQYLLRPGVAGGFVGLVNVGLLAGVGYSVYSKPLLRRDPAAISATVFSTLALLFAEGYLTEQYAETPQGQEQARHAKEKGSALALWIDDSLHRPTTYHALVGSLNTVVAGGIGYFTYMNWNRPWDRKTISAVSVGLLGLVGLDGYVLENYKEL